MVVNVAKGQIYSVQNVDNSAYSSLAADTTNSVLKQGVILTSTALTLTAPTTAGQSINYLIQVAYTDTDAGATTLPYYNAANPSVAYSGPNNSGTAQNTVRSGVCTVALKAGVAATTGTQTTPSVDTGYTAAWVITVAQGATAITAANISVAPNAPFLPSSGIVSAIQQCTTTFAIDTGAANAYAAQFVPALPTLVDGMRVTFKAKTANTGASTFAANGNTAYPLYSHANQALQGGEIIANGLIEVEWNSTLTAWVMCGNSGGALPVAAATQSNHAMQLGQATGRRIGSPRVFTASGIYTPTAGTNWIEVLVVGAGGGGGGASATSSGYMAGGSGGGGGGYAMSRLTSGFSGIQVTAGIAGVGGDGSPSNGGKGGDSSFGSLLTATGGSGGEKQPGVKNTSLTLQLGAAGGVGSSGNILNASGGVGGQLTLNTDSNSTSGTGGSSYLSGTTKGVGANNSGNAGMLGGGGSGAVSGSSPNAGYSGGAGGGGCVIIWEYS